MNEKTATKILLETEIGYDLISDKFSQTRKHFWRELEFIKDYTREGNNVFDFGCGNGRLLELLGDVQNFQYYGLDVSQGLVDLAKKRYLGENVHFFKIDPSQASLTFQDNFFNAVYSIAVFHHFPSQFYRQQVADELYRTTAKKGYIVITVWNLWQKKYYKNILKNWIAKIKGESDLDWNDCAISFTNNKGEKFQRYHHAFTKWELEGLFVNAGFKIKRCDVMDGRNILLIGKKE